MKAVMKTMQILVITLLTVNVRCQEGYSNRDLIRLHQIASNGQIESIYSANNIQQDPSSQSVSSLYQMTDNTSNHDYNRADLGRSRKVYRIKNPFQRQIEDEGRQQDGNPQDSDAGASNQYAAMQYSLPPEEFLQQMRAENQYNQQQQHQQQVSTPVPSLGYTATPQPQYQYSTIAASGFDNTNQQSNQVAHLEPKMSQAQTYHSITNPYQYSGPNSYGLDNVQSTPAPVTQYLSTSLPNSQFVNTPSDTYVSSSLPFYLSSPQNTQQYVSSSISAIQTGTPDYNNKVTSTLGSNTYNYDSSDMYKNIQLDHFDNSANGVRYPIGSQQQYHEYPSSTSSPTSTSYSDTMRDSWQNTINANANTLSKSLQEVSLSQYPNYSYNKYQQDGRSDQSSENVNSDIHRIGNQPSANNVYLNFVQPDHQALSNLRSRTRDAEKETSHPDFYSHGEYGWKLVDKKPFLSLNGFSSTNYPKYQAFSSQHDGPVSQMSFQMDNSRPHNYEQISKSSPDNSEAQEFAKAAAKAHENLKRQQQYENEYASSFNNNNKPLSGTSSGNNYYENNENQRNRVYGDHSNPTPYQYGNPQQDLITAASPYYFTNPKENEKSKQPFDHDKALKNIVPIDVPNIVNTQNQQRNTAGSDNNSRYNAQNYAKDQLDQNLKQNYKSISDAYYRDKNAMYGFNIKSKAEEERTISSDGYKQQDSNIQYYGKQPSQEQYYSHNAYSDNQRYNDESSKPQNPRVSNSYQDSVQSLANVQQGYQRPQSQEPSDIASILKLNDVPYRFTQNIPADTYKFYNNNFEQVGLPTPLPIRLNQNIGNHQLDVAANILNKLMLNKQPGLNFNRPDIDPQSGGLSTINGFKVANPFNVDLKLVTEMLKGKPAVDEQPLLGLRDQYNKPAPLKLDISQLQQLLLNNGNSGNLAQLNDGLGAYSSYLDIYNNGRFPYQGVKYSRSQEEEESIIPIADGSNNHPIGAVMEQDDIDNGQEVSTGVELTEQDDENLTNKGFSEERPKNLFSSSQRLKGDRPRHPNSLLATRHSYQRRYPKSDVAEPHRLLKPPPQIYRNRGSHNKNDSRRRRVRRPKVLRLMKTEPLFEAGSEDNVESGVPTLLRPPPPNAEAKSDVIDDESSS